MKTMNRIVMVIWGLVIVSMCTLIYMIGYKQQDLDYLSIAKELKKAGETYANDNRLSLTTKIGNSSIIYIDDLLKGQYIKEDEKIQDYCIEGVVYSNNLIKDSYTIKQNCEGKKSE